MKKYEYKYVKREGPEISGIMMEETYNADEQLLTGYGLDGWRVNRLLNGFWLLKREIEEKES
jgi:hypothetical protein